MPEEGRKMASGLQITRTLTCGKSGRKATVWLGYGWATGEKPSSESGVWDGIREDVDNRELSRIREQFPEYPIPKLEDWPTEGEFISSVCNSLRSEFFGIFTCPAQVISWAQAREEVRCLVNPSHQTHGWGWRLTAVNVIGYVVDPLRDHEDFAGWFARKNKKFRRAWRFCAKQLIKYIDERLNDGVENPIVERVGVDPVTGWVIINVR